MSDLNVAVSMTAFCVALIAVLDLFYFGPRRSHRD
jgi:hypothetical protein